MPGSGKEVDADGVASDEVRLHLLQGGPNEVRDFKVKRAQHQEDRVLRGHVAQGLRTTGDGARLRAGVRVLLAGADAQPGLAGPRRPRQSCAVRRGKRGLDRGRRRARSAAPGRAAGAKARLPGPARPDRRGLQQTDRAGAQDGPVRSRPSGPARAGGSCPRARLGQVDARPYMSTRPIKWSRTPKD